MQSDINQKNQINNKDDNEEKKENKVKKYITPSQRIDEESGENENNYTPGAGLGKSSLQYSINNNNPYINQIDENINDSNNNNNIKKENQFEENINDSNNNNDNIIKKSQFGENINDSNNNNINYFKKSIIQNPIEDEMRISFVNRFNQLNPNITKISPDYNYIFDPNKNKEKAKEIKEIIKEREQNYKKNKKDYKEIIYNIMKDNKNKSEHDPKFMEYYNKVIENNNIPELKTIALEYQQKEEKEEKEEKEKKESKKETIYESNPVIDIEGILDQEKIKSSNIKNTGTKNNYDSVEMLLEKKGKNLQDDL
jgi:hypothetical protein